MINSAGNWVVVVPSDSIGPRFESSHGQKLILNVFCQLHCKDETKRKKEAGNGPLNISFFQTSCDELRKTIPTTLET